VVKVSGASRMDIVLIISNAVVGDPERRTLLIGSAKTRTRSSFTHLTCLQLIFF
jgi:hypothetical protein